MWFRIETPVFSAGGEYVNGLVDYPIAPILRKYRGLTQEYFKDYCRRQAWRGWIYNEYEEGEKWNGVSREGRNTSST